jgi:hypothetical protein
MIAQVDSMLGLHNGRIGIGSAHLQISQTLIVAPSDAAVLCSQLLNPVMPLGILLSEVLLLLC